MSRREGRDRCGAQTHVQPANPVFRRAAVVRGGDGGVLLGDNQAELMRHRAREPLAGQRTAALNALRGHLEIGLIAPQGAQHAYGLKRMAADGFNENGEIVVPDCVRGALRSLVGQIDALDEAIGAIDRELAASVKTEETAKRLMTHSRRRPGHRIGYRRDDPGRQRLRERA